MAKSRIKKHTRVKQREKVKKRKKKRVRKVLKGVAKLSLGFLVVAGLAVAGKKAEDFLLTSPHFRISEVNFEGPASLKKKTLDSLNRMELGKNIFRVDLGAIRRRLQNYPQVKEVVVSRKFPRLVEVKVKEREAIAFVRNGSKIYPVDTEGFVIPRDSLSRSLPLITGLGEGGMKPGERLEGAKMDMALEVLETFSASGLSISRIELGGRSPVVRIGAVKIFLAKEADRIKERKELRAILSDLRRRGEKAKYIDLRFNNPVVKLR
jgi:cell division protein FtsQ